MDQRLMVTLESTKENGHFSFSMQYGIPYKVIHSALDDFRAALIEMEKTQSLREAELKAKNESSAKDK